MKKIVRVFKIAGIVLIIVFGVLALIPVLIIQFGKQKIYTDVEKVPGYDVAIVFGAGIKENRQPNDMLRDRLDTVAELYYSGKVKKMLLSGDNSEVDYNEPQVMYNYLLHEHDIRAEDLVRDYAGLRTYDTCARAKNIWKIDKAILISQGYHLSRAIFTCNNLDIESSGFSATRYYYYGERYYKTREILALYRAVWDIFISPPEYIKGTLELDFIE
jgi:SanA protein